RKLAKQRTVVAVAEGLSQQKLLTHDDYDNKFDPHVWMDPDLWAEVVSEIQKALTDVSPEQKQAFAANAQKYLRDVRKLAAYAKQVLATVPEDSRVLLTAHDAFNYFGRAYGFEVIGIQGISTESEAGLKRIRELVDMLVRRKIAAVFVESSVSDRNIRALIEGAAALEHEVTIGGELFSDAMGPDGSYEGTYIGMIDHNATTIARALGGKAPARGVTGRLAEKQ
ncbi:MAG: zinc ABC transporter substrate-binding protein, partial [Pseudomonadota bacterium]